jgi:putative flippase GtrA
MRFWRFNAVGVLGFAVQLAVLALLVRLGLHYLAATVLAVEAAILHNFLWHERWTWRDRPSAGAARLTRLARFHALNGAISLAGNLLLMRLLVGALGMPPLPANLIAVLACALVNYAASDRAVFQADAMRPAERSASATKVRVPFVHPPVGSVGEPTTNRLS